MVALDKAYLLALCLSATAKLTEPVLIVGDTDRNGVIDVNDRDGRDLYTEQRGAIFMANIGDATGECAQQALTSSDEDMRKCNDARGEIQRNPKYLARAKIYPLKNAPAGTFGTIELSGRGRDQNILAQDNVRVFRLIGDETRGDGWEFVGAQTRFSSDELNAGIELGVDSRGFMDSNLWDGYVTVTLSVTDGDTNEVTSDKVELRVAPLLLHHNLQKLEQVFTVSSNMIEEDQFGKGKQEKFVQDVIEHSRNVVHGNVVQFEDKDRWVQDWFEAGYTSMPGKDEPVVLRVMIRSSRIDNPQDRKVFSEMRSHNTGAIQMPFPEGTTDARKALFTNQEGMGNLELIPPYRDTDGVVYAYGRALTGSYVNDYDYYLPAPYYLLASQGMSPVDVDLTWTAGKHIDQIVQILPAKNEFGFVLAVADAESGMHLLLQHADIRVSMPHPDIKGKGIDTSVMPGLTVGELAISQKLVRFNEAVARRIDSLINQLMEETKLPEEYIVRIPTPFYQAFPSSEKLSWAMFHMDLSNPEIDEDFLNASPLYANFINGLVKNENTYLYPKTWGPETAGRDIFRPVYERILEGLGLTGQAMDTWFSHHIGLGELHCGTNALRDAKQKWWVPWEERNRNGQTNEASVGTTTHTETTSTADQAAAQAPPAVVV